VANKTNLILEKPFTVSNKTNLVVEKHLLAMELVLLVTNQGSFAASKGRGMTKN
jgi:hypothetical protein